MQNLKAGARGVRVAKLQRDLTQLGEKVIVNGIFGPSTADAVSRFQRQCGLQPSGEVDQDFLKLLEKALAPKTEAVRLNTLERVVLRSPINGFDGYGFHGSQIASDLIDLGYDVRIRASADEATVKCKIPEALKRRFVPREAPQPDDWELLLWPADSAAPTPGKKTIYFSMWESTRLPKHAVTHLNQAEVVVVPCEWNAACFSANGVSVPIRVAQLGILTEHFKYSPMKMDGPTIFGAAGRLAHGGMRKGLGDVITAFLKAFPDDPNVRLKIKCFPDCPINAVSDPRIQLTQALLTWEEMAQWMSSITSFVSASKGEGFGLLQLQSLACGRPLIAAKFSGLTEFFDEDVGYPVRYTLMRSEGVYQDCGCYARPDVDSIAEQMKVVHNNRTEAQTKGTLGAVRTSNFSWKNANLRLLKVMKEFGMVS